MRLTEATALTSVLFSCAMLKFSNLLYVWADLRPQTRLCTTSKSSSLLLVALYSGLSSQVKWGVSGRRRQGGGEVGTFYV